LYRNVCVSIIIIGEFNTIAGLNKFWFVEEVRV